MSFPATLSTVGKIIAGAKRCSARDTDDHDAVYVTVTTRGWTRFWCDEHLPDQARALVEAA